MEGISVFRFDFAGNGKTGMQKFRNREISGFKAASKYHDVHTVVNLSGRLNLQHGMETRLGKNFLEKIRKDGFIDGKTNPVKRGFPISNGLELRMSTVSWLLTFLAEFWKIYSTIAT